METPRKRLVWPAVIGAALALVAGIVALSRGDNEPRYEGKTFGYWIGQENRGLTQPERDKAEAAVLCLATNNLPLLLEWIREDEPAEFEPRYVTFINQLLSHQKLLRIRLRSNLFS